MDQIFRAEELEQKRSYCKQHIDSWQVTGLTQAGYCPATQSEAPPAGLLEKAIFAHRNGRILRAAQIRGFAG